MITWSRWQVTAKVIFPAVTRLFVRSRTQTYDIEGQVFLHIYSAPVQNVRSLDLHSQLIVFHFQLTTPTPISLVKTFFPYPVCQDSNLCQWRMSPLPHSCLSGLRPLTVKDKTSSILYCEKGIRISGNISLEKNNFSWVFVKRYTDVLPSLPTIFSTYLTLNISTDTCWPKVHHH